MAPLVKVYVVKGSLEMVDKIFVVSQSRTANWFREDLAWAAGCGQVK